MEYKNCTYSVLDNGIHKFVFAKPNKAAVDEHVAALQTLYEAHTPDDMLNILIDVRPAGWPPMVYAMTSLRKLNAEAMEHAKERYAFLYTQSALVSLAQSFFNQINRGNRTSVRFFHGDQEAEAVAWLLDS